LTALSLSGYVLRAADEPRDADVIVALSGDTGARALTAAALFDAGYAPLIIFSGGSADTGPGRPAGMSSAEIMAASATRVGVPRSAIIVETKARTTAENARFVREVMERNGLRTALLVTSPYHQRRAALEFARAFEGSDLTFRNVPAVDPEWDVTLWWADPDSFRLTVTEFAKLSIAYLSE
jgi:uncharacterized SAM-binding protein YcdF (DUF218 family)